jgi:hypothetical protein
MATCGGYITPKTLSTPQIAKIRYGDGRIGHLRALQPPCPGPAHQIPEPFHEFVHGEGVRVVDRRRNDPAFPQCHGNAEVY